MYHPSPSIEKRSAQISASTIFALTLAILAGLVGAYLFKTYFMNPKAPATTVTPPPAKKTVWVAAVNLTDNVVILPQYMKSVSVTEKQADDWQKKYGADNPPLMRQNEAVGLLTKVPIKADEPIYEQEVERQRYPRPVSEELSPGMVMVTVEVPAREALIQIGDHVDVLCTIRNDAFAPVMTATAAIAKNAKVLARFTTTRKGGLPNPKDPTRAYHLEVTRYRAALIELARSPGIGGALALAVVYRPKVDQRVPGGMAEAPRVEEPDPNTDHVTAADLARIFGIRQFRPPIPDRSVVIQRVIGVKVDAPFVFPPTTPALAPPVKPGTDLESGVPRLNPSTGSMAAGSSDGPTIDPDAPNGGFRPPSGPGGPACKTCGKK